MHQRVYQPNPARANRSNSARYSQGHGIWAFQTIHFFWRMNVVQSRDNPSWQEGQQHFHKLKTNMLPICRFNRLLCRLSLVYCESGPKMSKGIGLNFQQIRDIDIYRPCKCTQQIGPFECGDTPRDWEHVPFHLTQNMDLARGSKVFPCFSSMKKIRKRSRTPSACRALA